MWRRRSKTFHTAPIGTRFMDDLNSSQAKVPGFDLKAMQSAHVLEIGAGGIGAPVARALVRKGLGRLSIIDDDLVELKI